MNKFSLEGAKTIRQAIAMTLGYATVCWKDINGEKVLDSEALIQATDELEGYFLNVLSESHGV